MAIHHLSLLMVVAMVVLCLAMNHVPPSMQQDEKPPEPSVKDILTELKSGKRYVFAAGLDNTKMLLFISGNEASIAFGSGLQVESPGEPVNGSFAHLEKAKNLSKYPSAKFSADELVFAVKDSKGVELVGMSKQGVNVLSLSSGSFDHLKLKEFQLIGCYHEGSLHISSDEAGIYYVLDSKGNLDKITFSNTDSVALSKSCLDYPLGNLCYQGKKMTLSDTCKDPPPKDIVSGLVTSGSAYLFTKAGDLYLFSASLFKQSSGSVDVTVVKAEEAWPTGGAASSSAKPPAPTTRSSDSMLIIGIVVGVALLLVVCGGGAAYYIIKQNQPKKSKDAQPSSSIGSFKRQVTAVNQRDHGLDSKQDRSRSRSLKGGARTETGAGPSTGKQQQQRGESEGGASAPAPADLPGAPHYHLNVIVRPKQGKDSEKYDVDGPYGNSTLSEALHDGEDPGTEAAAEAALKSKNLPDDTAEMTMEYQSHSHSDVGPPPPPPPPTSSKAQTPKSAKKKKTKESKRKKSKKGRGGSKKSKQKKKTKSKKKDSLKKTASKQSKQSKQSKKHRGSAKKGSGQKKSSVKKSKVQGSAKKKTGGSSQKKAAAAGAASSASRKGGGGSSAKQQPQQQTTMMASKKSAKGQTSSAKGQNSSSANKK